MKAVIQRVSRSEVTVAGQPAGSIGCGLLVLLGVARGDTPTDVEYLANKICQLRIFEDDAGKMNRSLIDTGGEMLVVSQFTLLADCRKGRRPSFTEAAPPPLAKELYEQFIQSVQHLGIHTQSGVFGAMMAVTLVNDGPVSLIIESR
jgi:D-tyrosyl-tRNA(Tyr) deacylase